jgi:hypothetical protein
MLLTALLPFSSDSARAGTALGAKLKPEPGLLFYLSGDKETAADFAANGHAEPNFLKDVGGIPDGARGAALRCEHTQRLAWWAPGNIYAQRGTLSFFWRAREPVGPTEFPIFRVAYGDHSSWDMVWLRIDYNGHGFDAFVTDINLSRTRVSVTTEPFLNPNEWIHLALAWDEATGIRFYINGKLAAEKRLEAPTRYDAQLDQFGPHSRIISPYQVQSDYNFVRGGDLDELRIYDRALGDPDIATLAQAEAPPALAPLPGRSLADERTRAEWSHRYGWNRANDLPPHLPHTNDVSIRKVEIHDAFDLKRWWWKANDGIRETTWPGVYNRSRLPGRTDYFILPDWDCYSLSGKAVTFTLPHEPWNHLEISGAAWGSGSLETATSSSRLFERARGQERTIHRVDAARTAQKIRFENAEQEQPIGEFAAYYVTAAREPTGARTLAYRVSGHATSYPGVEPLLAFVHGRHPRDEQAALVAEPVDAPTQPGPAIVAEGLPLLHVFIPARISDELANKDYALDKVSGALDGIAIDLPAWSGNPATNISFNVQVKDPLWPARNLLDFTFTADSREARTLWLDTRDRILPEDRGLYLTIAASEHPGNIAALAPSQIRLVFKDRAAGLAEHEIDRFTQVRDNYAMLVEENPRERGYQLRQRFEDDLNDLLRVNPDHLRALQYKADAFPGSVKPPFTLPTAPEGVPLWAFRQVDALRRAKELVLWYIDHRQIENGELGGGLSDDTDMTNFWPGIALMGAEPDKIAASVSRVLDACYAQGMVTNGLPTIQTDELHTYEEGINALGQNLILNYGSPRQIERALETSRGLASITGINHAGHRHIRSTYFSGTRIATEGVWGWSKAYSYLVFQPMQMLVDYNGDPAGKKLLIELADGLLAHRKPGKDGQPTIPTAIHFETDAEAEASRNFSPWALFWNAWQWTHDRKYLQPILDGGLSSIAAINPNVLDLLDQREAAEKFIRTSSEFDARDPSRPAIMPQHNPHFMWRVTGNKTFLENLYATLIERMENRWYINTEGSLWIDRINMSTSELQRARLGGVALVRNAIFPGHIVSWRFQEPAKAESVAILIPDSTGDAFKVIAHNLESIPVTASMTGGDVNPGDWEIIQGVDADGDDQIDGEPRKRTESFERSRAVTFTFPARVTTILTLKNVKPGRPYQERPDIGIDPQDVTIRGSEIAVQLHSLGSVEAPASSVALISREGKILVQTATPTIPAPLDWSPKTAQVTLTLPDGIKPAGCSVVIDPAHALTEITTNNNAVKL